MKNKIVTEPVKISGEDFSYVLSYYNESNYKFGGGFTINGKSFAIKEIIYNNPATIVFWDDNTKTVAKCHTDDVYNPETGLSICVLKKIAGGVAVKKLMDDWLPEGSARVTLKDVRAKYKNN